MLFRYNIELHLTYNRMALYDRTPDSEFRVELEKPFVWELNQIVQIKAENGEQKTFSDTYKIELSSVWKENIEKNHIEKNHMPEPYFRMTIENILGETKEAAGEYLSGTVERICKNLTLEINHHNCNRHHYQPRVEADWSHAVWKKQEYEPYLEYLENQGNGREFHVWNHMTEGFYMTSCLKFREGKIDYKNWTMPENEAYEFLMNEYYIALGQEDAKSKFFHLFSIIEYIEHRYEQYNGAIPLYPEKTRKEIGDMLQELLAKRDDFSSKERKQLCGQVSGALARAANIGRADKLKNILQHMKIEKLKIHDHEIEVDRTFLQKMIALRNKTFHGEGKDLQEYIQAGPEMLYLCEMILEAVRKGM